MDDSSSATQQRRRRRRTMQKNPTDLVGTGAQVTLATREMGKDKAEAADMTFGEYLERLIINDPVDASGVPLWALEERKRDEDAPSLDFETE